LRFLLAARAVPPRNLRLAGTGPGSQTRRHRTPTLDAPTAASEAGPWAGTCSPLRHAAPRGGAEVRGRLRDLLATVTFDVLYVFFVLSLDRCRRLHIDVTAHPYAARAAQQIVEAIGFDTLSTTRFSPPQAGEEETVTDLAVSVDYLGLAPPWASAWGEDERSVHGRFPNWDLNRLRPRARKDRRSYYLWAPPGTASADAVPEAFAAQGWFGRITSIRSSAWFSTATRGMKTSPVNVDVIQYFIPGLAGM
jgi:hypothetical protein